MLGMTGRGGKVWNLIVLKITGFKRFFFTKITGLAD